MDNRCLTFLVIVGKKHLLLILIYKAYKILSVFFKYNFKMQSLFSDLFSVLAYTYSPNFQLLTMNCYLFPSKNSYIVQIDK